jgi:hypothetical protein
VPAAQNATKDLLLLLTEHYKFAVLEWVPSGPSGQPELVTRATCDVKDAIGRPVEAGQLAAVDPDCRAIALHLYEGQLKVNVLHVLQQCEQQQQQQLHCV